MANVHPVLLPALSPSDFINYALQHPSPATTLLICNTRPLFLASLAASIHDTAENDLLHATLHQIASSRSIALAYLPTLSHLRAYMAVLQPKTATELQSYAKSDTRTPLLLVYGILNLHRDTSEWSAQGLGTTMASLVENGSRHGYEIVMCEEDVGQDAAVMDAVADGDEETSDLQKRERDELRRTSSWKEEMPMLNGSTRRLVAGADEATGWAGRTVEVGRVLQRWCVFKESY